MPETTETTTVDGPREDVFRRVADFSRLAEWDPTFVHSERVDDGPLGVGSTFDCRMRVVDVEVPMVLEVVEYDEPSHVTLSGSGDGFTTREEITVGAPDGEGRVRVTYASGFDTDTPDWLDALGQPAFTLVGKAAIRGLHDHVEADG